MAVGQVNFNPNPTYPATNTASMSEESYIAMRRKAAKEIDREIGSEALLEKLMEYPEKIRRQQEVVSAVQQTLDNLTQNLEQIKAELMAVLSAETDPKTGKPAFSNKETREAELVRRMGQDPEVRNAMQEVQNAQGALNSARFDLVKLENEFAAIKAAARITAARLELMAQ